MNAQELRVGNWVKRDSQPDGFVVDGASILRCERHEEWYEPIPLTPEWLEKFGFEVNEGDGGTFKNWRQTYSLKIMDECYIEISKRNNNFGISQCEKDNNIRRNLIAFNRQLLYIHRLQNLYFALTGTELTIKEPATK